MVSRTSLFEA